MDEENLPPGLSGLIHGRLAAAGLHVRRRDLLDLRRILQRTSDLDEPVLRAVVRGLVAHDANEVRDFEAAWEAWLEDVDSSLTGEGVRPLRSRTRRTRVEAKEPTVLVRRPVLIGWGAALVVGVTTFVLWGRVSTAVSAAWNRWFPEAEPVESDVVRTDVGDEFIPPSRRPSGDLAIEDFVGPYSAWDADVRIVDALVDASPWVLAVAAVLLGVFGWLCYSRFRRIARRLSTGRPTKVDPDAISFVPWERPGAGALHHEATSLSRAAWGVARFVDHVIRDQLDVPTSVDRTARAGGLPDPWFVGRARARSVWVWRDSDMISTVANAWCDELVSSLGRLGLHVNEVWFEGVPDVLVDERGVARQCEDVEDREGALVLVVTDGRELTRRKRAPAASRCLRSLSSWPHLAVVDWSSADVPLDTLTQRFGIVLGHPDDLPSLLGEGPLRTGGSRRPRLGADLSRWRASLALWPARVRVEDAQALRPRVSDLPPSALMALGDSLDGSVPISRADALGPAAEQAVLGRGLQPEVREGLAFWRSRLARHLRRQRGSGWRHSRNRRERSLQAGVLELWGNPRKAARRFSRLVRGGGESRVREVLSGYAPLRIEGSRPVRVIGKSPLPWTIDQLDRDTAFLLIDAGLHVPWVDRDSLDPRPRPRERAALAVMVGMAAGLLGFMMVGLSEQLFQPVVLAGAPISGYFPVLPFQVGESRIAGYVTPFDGFRPIELGPRQRILGRWVQRDRTRFRRSPEGWLIEAPCRGVATRPTSSDWPAYSLVCIQIPAGPAGQEREPPSDALELADLLLREGSADAVIVASNVIQVMNDTDIGLDLRGQRLGQCWMANLNPDSPQGAGGMPAVSHAEPSSLVALFRERGDGDGAPVDLLSWADGSGLSSFPGTEAYARPVLSPETGRVSFLSDLLPRFKMLALPGGRFWMGAQSGSSEQPNFDPLSRRLEFRESPVHEVELNPFGISRHEVTRDLWRWTLDRARELDATASELEALGRPAWIEDEGDGQLPATQVDWYQAVHFCNVLSRVQGLKPCYSVPADDEVSWLHDEGGYRLPTEAEWEYACRGGRSTPWPWGASSAHAEEFAWFGMEVLQAVPRAVGSKRPNRFGLFDFPGNVAEWCWDRAGDALVVHRYTSEPSSDPRGRASGGSRVIRGGTVGSAVTSLRSSARRSMAPATFAPDVGFRVVRRTAEGR